MGNSVTVQRTEGIAVLTIDNPPANALSQPVRAALQAAIGEVGADPATRAVVLAARGKDFATGANLQEVGEETAPLPGEVALAIEHAEIPVVAALHGAVGGGGLELALAAHYRIADRRATFAFPEVSIGLCPSAGATQRLPRLIGPKAAAEMLVTARRIDAATAEKAGLIDEIADGPLPVYTLKQVLRRVGKGLAPRPTMGQSERLAPAKPHLEALRRRREKVAGRAVPATSTILDCIEASLLLPPDAGLAFEKAAYDDLVSSDESRALRGATLAERRAGEPPLEADAQPRRIDTVGVVGAGFMGTGIAAACLEAGLPVTLVEASLERLEAGVDNVIDIFDRQVARGRLNAEARDARIGRLNGQTDPAALSGADLVIEATTEDAEIKRRVMSALDAVMKRGAVLATTTSSIDIDGLAAGTARSGDMIGLHFIPPAHVIRLCEVVIAMDTSDDVIATAFAFLKRLGKVPIATGVGEGYVAGRIQGAYAHAAEAMLAAGAGIAQVDGAMREFGFAMGPFEMADLAGLDTDLARRKRVASSEPGITQRLLRMGRAGRRVGKGFYVYKPGAREGEVDPDVTALIAEMQELSGWPKRTFSGEDIRRRCLAAMANEGARLVEEGIAARPSDIDIAMIAGYGFPRYRGGPMMTADLTGVLRVKRDIDRYTDEDPAFWNAAPLFSELVKSGRTFADLNR